jgi:hypothetical protein
MNIKIKIAGNIGKKEKPIRGRKPKNNPNNTKLMMHITIPAAEFL